MQKLLCLALALWLCWTGCAAAEPRLVPQLDQWNELAPVDVVLSADVRTHMPFDDTRCAQLNGLLKHLSLHLQTGGDVNRTALLVDGREALWLVECETESGPQTQVSWSDAIYACDMNTLLGSASVTLTENQRLTWLEDGVTLADGVAAALAPYAKEADVKTNIKNMGVARTKITCTVPKDEADVFASAVKANCPDSLKEMLASLAFSGQQKLILWRDEAGSILRVEYSGQCGRNADSLRKVSLTWRMRRDEDCTRDDITLKTPAVKGNDYNTLTCTRHVEKDESGVVSYELDYDYAVRDESGKSTWAGAVSLTGTPAGDDTQLTGSAALSSKPAGADAEETLVLAPNLLLSQQNGAPCASGLITVQEKRGKNLVEDADVFIEMGEGAYLLWTETDAAITPTQQQRETMTEAMGASLLPHLVLLPEEDTPYLSADLPEEAWQRIVEAAQTALAEEE